MQYEILYPGAFATLRAVLKKGESIKAESGAMVAMSETIEVDGKAEGGLFKGLGRMLAGESFFLQTLRAEHGSGEVLLAHKMLGEIYPLKLDGRVGYLIQKDGFFAASPSIDVSTKMQNLVKGLFSGEGFFIVKASGAATCSSVRMARIHPIDLADDQEVIVDNAHLVAWPETMDYKIQKASSGWISSWKSGEGLVCRFRGPGRVLIQTRNPGGFGNWLRQFIPTK